MSTPTPKPPAPASPQWGDPVSGVTYEPYPQTAAEALAAWDRGDIVWTIELGGLGPGYEQCIHIMAFEIIRDALAGPPLPKDDAGWKAAWSAFGDAAIRRCNLGVSRAQAGAAKNLAMHALRDGWCATLKSATSEQRTMVTRDFPAPPGATPTLVAERDALRAALRRIADASLPSSESYRNMAAGRDPCMVQIIRDVARAALAAGGTGA